MSVRDRKQSHDQVPVRERLRDRIEQCAYRKFLAREFEGIPPGIILRSIDFHK